MSKDLLKDQNTIKAWLSMRRSFREDSDSRGSDTLSGAAHEAEQFHPQVKLGRWFAAKRQQQA